MAKGVSIKITLPKRISDVVDSTVKMGIFSSPSDLGKTAIVKYLDDMRLLDQLKGTIETHAIDE